MKFSLLLAAAAASASASRDCLTRRMDDHDIKALMDYETLNKKSLVSRATEKALKVNVYFHNVANGTTYEEGYIEDDVLQQQFDIIHERYLPYGIKMSLGGIDHTINASWHKILYGGQAEADMKNALHKGTFTDVNIYTVDEVWVNDRQNDTATHIDFEHLKAVAVKAYSRFPSTGLVFDSDFIIDGVVSNFRVIYGTNTTGRAGGITLVHEIGHWFGLEHTYARGCVGLGDGIADTPNEDLTDVETNLVCPTARDTCPGQEGTDPVHNYMDTTTDDCRTEFTDGQVERMHAVYNLFRVPKVA